MKAIALLSGGLDSILAIRVAMDQDIEVEAMNYSSPFCTCTSRTSGCSAAATAAQQLGVPLKVINVSREFFEIVKNPPHGYGRNMNPCIDCRILIFRKAGEYMKESGASFIITGEVLGERPMSQRLEAMKLIETQSGLEGMIVRPLSAALLEPSIPEKEGWIDRSKLLAIRGRSRKPQIELAASYNIKNYPCPAGGCLLTDRIFASRMRDLVEHVPDFTINDVNLLKVGRHFRLSPGVKAVVGRDEAECSRIEALNREKDILLEDADRPGPLTLIRGEADQKEIELAAAIAARYCKPGAESIRVAIRGRSQETLTIQPADEETLTSLRISG